MFRVYLACLRVCLFVGLLYRSIHILKGSVSFILLPPPLICKLPEDPTGLQTPSPSDPFPMLSSTGVSPAFRAPCVHKILDRRGCERQQPVLPRVSPGVYREHASAVRGKGAFDRVPRQSREPRAGACATGASPYLCVAGHERLPPLW